MNTQISGFYYDFQMNNPLLTATLHTNTYISKVGDVSISSSDNPYEKQGSFKWDLWKRNNSEGIEDSSKDKPSEGKVFCLDPITHNYSLAYDENPSACYRAKPLIRSILNEDFQVEAGNIWADAGGDTGLEKTFNQLKSLAPILKETGGGLKNITDEVSKYVRGDGIIGKMNKFVGDLSNKITGWGADKLNSALITQGTRFSYYGGTSTTFGNLSMRFTIFADWIWDEENSDFVYKTVHDQLREIYPYAVGKYYPVDTNLGDEARHRGLTNLGNVGDAADKTISSFFGWQQPPGGFQADIRSLDVCQKGTLRLVLGGYYTAENLVISGMNVNFSKTMTKVPPKVKTYNSGGGDEDYSGTYSYEETNEKGEKVKVTKNNVYNGKSSRTYDFGETGENELTPLYADVTITLKPASTYSDTSIINFSSNNGRGKFNADMTKLRKNLIEEQKRKKEKAAEEEINRMDKNIKEDSGLYRLEQDYEEEPLPTSPPPSTKYHPA